MIELFIENRIRLTCGEMIGLIRSFMGVPVGSTNISKNWIYIMDLYNIMFCDDLLKNGNYRLIKLVRMDVDSTTGYALEFSLRRLVMNFFRNSD